MTCRTDQAQVSKSPLPAESHYIRNSSSNELRYHVKCCVPRDVFPRRKSGVRHEPRRSHSLGTFYCWESFIISGNDGKLLKSKFSDVSQWSSLQAGLSKNCHFRPLMSTFLPSHPASIIENFSTKFPFTAPVPSLHQCRRAIQHPGLSLS